MEVKKLIEPLIYHSLTFTDVSQKINWFSDLSLSPMLVKLSLMLVKKWISSLSNFHYLLFLTKYLELRLYNFTPILTEYSNSPHSGQSHLHTTLPSDSNKTTLLFKLLLDWDLEFNLSWRLLLWPWRIQNVFGEKEREPMIVQPTGTCISETGRTTYWL